MTPDPLPARPPPAALFHYSPDRKAEHPRRHLVGWQGILQADAYAGFNELYAPDRQPGPVIVAGCWAHARRKCFDLAERGRTPLAAEAVRRIDALFAIERDLTRRPAEERQAQRQQRSAILLAELEAWIRDTRAKLSRHADVAKAMDYMLTRWESFARFLGDGRICLSNNAAECTLRGIAIGRKTWLFAGDDRGGERAAAIYSLITTAKLNDVDPRAWLADVMCVTGGRDVVNAVKVYEPRSRKFLLFDR